MSKKEKCTRVKCNLLQAEVYVRFPVRVCGNGKVTRYCELQETPCSNGVVEKLVECDYPITAESVNSYADSADYRKNPEIIRQATPRQNLGDISDMQQVLRNDMSAMRDLMKNSQEVLAKLEEYKAKQGVQGKVEEKGVEENGEKV